MLFLNIPLLAFTYRLRGGGYFSLSSDAYARLVWAASLMLAYIDQRPSSLLWGAWVAVAAYVAMLIPHAYCQNMGKWPSPQKGWPSFFFPSWTQAGWASAPAWQRALYDASQMGCVALLRSILVCAPLALAGLSALNVVAAVVTLTILQPVGYLIGTYLMFFSLPSCKKFSTEWGEFFNGAAWALCMWWTL